MKRDTGFHRYDILNLCVLNKSTNTYGYNPAIVALIALRNSLFASQK